MRGRQQLLSTFQETKVVEQDEEGTKAVEGWKERTAPTLYLLLSNSEEGRNTKERPDRRTLSSAPKAHLSRYDTSCMRQLDFARLLLQCGKRDDDGPASKDGQGGPSPGALRCSQLASTCFGLALGYTRGQTDIELCATVVYRDPTSLLDLAAPRNPEDWSRALHNGLFEADSHGRSHTGLLHVTDSVRLRWLVHSP